MASESAHGLGWAHAMTIAFGLVLLVAGAAVLAVDPGWTVSPVGAGAALIGAGLTLVITIVARRRRERGGEVVVDERVTTISQRAGYRAFQATFALQGLLFAATSVTAFDPPLAATLGGLFALTAVVYLAAYTWYQRAM